MLKVFLNQLIQFCYFCLQMFSVANTLSVFLLCNKREIDIVKLIKGLKAFVSCSNPLKEKVL
jgi:hypothetical protein